MKRFDVLGIGNAIVDVLAFTDDAFLSKRDLKKGSMALIDESRAKELYADMGSATECSGGSAANTLAGIASLGGSVAFIGKVAEDDLGEIFAHDMRGVGVHFDSAPSIDGPATARCLIFVTPDAQRTMNTYLGACTQVTEGDIDEALIAQSEILYIEGYLWDQPHAIAAIKKAIETAKAKGKKIAFTLSDSFCVDRHREEFLKLVEQELDILFANESEITSLYKANSLDEALSHLKSNKLVAAITRSELGAVVVKGGNAEIVPTAKVTDVVDTTGAGDLFASGFLYGYSKGWALADCAALGNRCAGQIISQLGARTHTPLKALVA